MIVHVLILNYNGRRLLAECLPSVLRAAQGSRHRCDVAVVDNASTDDSVSWLAERFPSVRVIARPNRGLCSFNDVVPTLEGPVAVLLNNDIQLDAGCIDPLIDPLTADSQCFMTAPLCRRMDDDTYEGFKTAVRWRWGLVQATALFPGHEAAIDRPGLTASAGAAMAVDCRKFVALGGFDPLYLPGRLEDLDFAFRGYMAGYHARYIPEAVARHRGMATFGEAFGRDGCDALALRNTLLFQWKNLRHPRHLLRQCMALPLRLACDVCRSVRAPRRRRWMFLRALRAALGRAHMLRSPHFRAGGTAAQEYDFFDRFRPERLVSACAAAAPEAVPSETSRPCLPHEGIREFRVACCHGALGPGRHACSPDAARRESMPPEMFCVPRAEFLDGLCLMASSGTPRRSPTESLPAVLNCPMPIERTTP